MNIKACRLPLSFDASELQADLRRIAAGEWVQHFNSQYHDGGWSGVALRSIAGSSGLYSDPLAGNDAFADTGLLGRCPAFKRALDAFQCPLQSVRLLRLGPGCGIREHTDLDLGYEDGEIRMHIPVMTNAEVYFYLDGRRVVMGEGECWYLNVNLPHRVHNRGTTDRVHLVIDCAVDAWVRSIFESTETASFEALESPLDRFRALVLTRPDLQDHLAALSDRDGFVDATVQAGIANGHLFTADDVRGEMRSSQRSWNELRIVR